MEVRLFVVNTIKKNMYLKNLKLSLTNKLKINKNMLSVDSVHFSRNTINIKGKKHEIKCKEESFLRTSRVWIDGNNNKVITESNTQVYDSTFYISGSNNVIVIGKDSIIRNSSFFINGDNNEIILGDNISTMTTEYHIEQNGNHLIISDGCTFHGRNSYPIHIALDEASKVFLDEDCMLSNGIQIRSTDSHSIIDEKGRRINPAEDIYIGKHCWIGFGSIILKGVNIPNNTVVAAGAVCTRKYDTENSILAGNPAKVVKMDIDWDRKFIE